MKTNRRWITTIEDIQLFLIDRMMEGDQIVYRRAPRIKRTGGNIVASVSIGYQSPAWEKTGLYTEVFEATTEFETDQFSVVQETIPIKDAVKIMETLWPERTKVLQKTPLGR